MTTPGAMKKTYSSSSVVSTASSTSLSSQASSTAMEMLSPSPESGISYEDQDGSRRHETKERNSSHPSVSIPANQDYGYNADAWTRLSSKVRKSGRALEFVLEWDEGQNDEKLAEIADLAIGETRDWFASSSSSIFWGNNDEKASKQRSKDLSSSLRCFVEHCRSNLTDIRSYKLKLSAMHGKTATRCPLWHTDDVPIRWIQSYLGPGCVYLNEDEFRHSSSSSNDGFHPYLQRVRESEHAIESKTLGDNWKEELVKRSGISVSQSPTGEATMLVGRMWPAWSNEKVSSIPTEGPKAGVLHRSPHNVPRGQDRILLNLDVVCAYEHSDEKEKHHHQQHQHDHSNCDCACQQ